MGDWGGGGGLGEDRDVIGEKGKGMDGEEAV